MVHQSQIYIDNTILSNTLLSNVYLNSSQVDSLLNCLNNDAKSYIYSATVSVGDAILGLRYNRFTWATVKLYYSTFYSLRAFLALDNICIFYHNRKPYYLEVESGKSPQKASGTTHKVVLEEFKRLNTNHLLLSQEIDLANPLNWLMEKREESNYKNAKFTEPEIPVHFTKIMQSQIRGAIEAYLTDSDDFYTFDKDHAILAYPLKCIQLVYKKIQLQEQPSFSIDDMNYLCNLFTDTKGNKIPAICKIIKGN
jgi:uncharacterized protein (UPF0332 family)